MGKGKTVTAKVAELIWETDIKGNKGEAKRLCESLGYKKTKYYKIINNEGEVNDTSYSRSKRWSPQQIDACIGFIENINPQVTLQDLHDIFVSQFNYPDISVSTLKLFTQFNQMRNDPFNKIKRRNYSNWFF
ncbi:hypothetical protein M9Y10_001748 [Tritrichomonas musculus]|uniref:Uncharacterized protein n=1 Tax=Tritrichomonas musculus TaxID=1915356 RepID=A0ABR2L9J4_9EUKA